MFDFDNYRYELGPAQRVSNLYPQSCIPGASTRACSGRAENIVNLVRYAWAAVSATALWSGRATFTAPDRFPAADLRELTFLAGIPLVDHGYRWFSDGDPQDPGFRELLVRWFQFGAFCPVMRLHGDRMPARMIYRKDGTPPCTPARTMRFGASGTGL